MPRLPDRRFSKTLPSTRSRRAGDHSRTVGCYGNDRLAGWSGLGCDLRDFLDALRYCVRTAADAQKQKCFRRDRWESDHALVDIGEHQQEQAHSDDKGKYQELKSGQAGIAALLG